MNNTENNLEQRDDELNELMKAHPAEESVKVLVKEANRTKRNFRILAISVVLDIVLSIGLAYFAYQTNQAVQLAQSNRAAVIANCEVANHSRSDQKALWDFVFALPALEPPTAEETARANQFKAFIADTFKERDCQTEIKSTD